MFAGIGWLDGRSAGCGVAAPGSFSSPDEANEKIFAPGMHLGNPISHRGIMQENNFSIDNRERGRVKFLAVAR
jgi:hypothetical protein